MRNFYDVIVVGGGPAGSYIAYTLSKDGFQVCLVDSNPRDLFGYKPCGGISSPLILDYFKKMNLEKEDIIQETFDEVILLDNQLNSLAQIKIPLVHIDRKKLGNNIVQELMEKNVHIINNTRAIKLDIKDDFVIGIFLSNGMHLKSSLIIDASGFSGLLRSQLISRIPEWSIDKEDLIIAILEKIRGLRVFNTFTLIVDKGLFPGGYGWITPSKEIHTVGLGLQPIVSNIALRYRLSVLKKNFQIRGEKLETGIGLIYARRPFPSLVYNGYALIGESGSQGNPLFGGGVFGALIAAEIAHRQIKKALETSESQLSVSMEELWRYNIEFMRNRGKLLATLDVLRLFAQGLTEEELKEFISYLPEKISFKLKDIVKIGIKALKTITRSRIFWRIFDVYRAVVEVQNIYDKYPKRVNEFKAWAKKDAEIFTILKKKLSK